MNFLFLPHFLIRRLSRNDGEAVHMNALLSVLLTAIALESVGSSGVANIVDLLPHFCLFEEVLGIHCPGCDMTTALVALLQLNVYRSIQIQPCTAALVITVFVQSVIRGCHLLRCVNFSQANRSVEILDQVFLAVLISFWFVRLISS